MSRLPLLPGFPRPLLFAHRGVSSLAPENTWAAFKLARDLGIPGVELDLHLTADGELVVFHDHFTGRLAGAGELPPGPGAVGKGLEVERSTWAQLADLDIGSWKGPEFAGERPMLFRDLLAELGEAFYWDIELKSKVAADYGLEAATAAALRDAKLVGRCHVSSFNPISLARFKALEPRVPTAIIWSAERDVPSFLRLGQGRWLGRTDALKPAHGYARPALSFLWRLERYPVVPWTVDDAAEAARVLAGGCEGVISNRPQELGLAAART